MFRQRTFIGLVFVVLSLVSATAYAHKVNVFAYMEGDQIFIQGYFSDGTKAKNSDVTVLGDSGQKLLKGHTNEEGVFIFPAQGKQALRVVLNAGMGHQASYNIPLEEAAAVSQIASNATPSAAGQSSSPDQSTDGSGGDSSMVSEAMVRKAVAQGVLPLALEISELKERRGFSDIVGGIGFIVGLLGVFAYVKAKQETRKIKSQ